MPKARSKNVGRWAREPERERHWRAVVSEWKNSGLSVRAFCKEKAIREPAFYAWRRELELRERESSAFPSEASAERTVRDSRGRLIQLQRRNDCATPLAPTFVPLTAQESQQEHSSSSSAGIDLHLPGGCFIRVSPASDFSLIGRILSVLEIQKC